MFSFARNKSIEGALNLGIVAVTVKCNPPPYSGNYFSDAYLVDLMLELFKQSWRTARFRTATVKDHYFTTTYGFQADSAWFARARLAALRIPGCSAGLVSGDGLIVTNHHCVRGRLASIARPGETLLDSGFVAPTLADERRIPGFFADQLVAAVDVTREFEGVASAGRAAVEARLRDELLPASRTAGDSMVVQFVDLYDGARTSAYVFRRLTDVRFVMAVELQMGFFGGDPDNLECGIPIAEFIKRSPDFHRVFDSAFHIPSSEFF